MRSEERYSLFSVNLNDNKITGLHSLNNDNFQQLKNIERIYEIDLLRFIAAMMVMLSHLSVNNYFANIPGHISSFVNYGFLGLPLFFIISGYVILMTAWNKSAKEFLKSRMARLFPAYWTSCTISFVAISYFSTVYNKAAVVTIPQYIINMTMALNLFHLYKFIDPVYWSLNIEIKFYGLIMVILLLKKMEKIYEFIVFWLILSIMATVFKTPLMTHYISRMLIINLNLRFAPYFIAGAMFYIIKKDGINKMKVIIIFICYILMIERAMDFPRNIYIQSIVLLAFLVSFFLISLNKTQRLKKRKFLILGALSYPIYLLHNDLSFIYMKLLGYRLNPYLSLFTFLSILFLISSLITNNIEKRALFSPR